MKHFLLPSLFADSYLWNSDRHFWWPLIWFNQSLFIAMATNIAFTGASLVNRRRTLKYQCQEGKFFLTYRFAGIQCTTNHQCVHRKTTVRSSMIFGIFLIKPPGFFLSGIRPNCCDRSGSGRYCLSKRYPKTWRVYESKGIRDNRRQPIVILPATKFVAGTGFVEFTSINCG